MDGMMDYGHALARELIPGYNQDNSAICLLTHRGRLQALVALTEWQSGVVGVSVGRRSVRWATPENIRALGQYIFETMGVRKLVALTEVDNRAATRVLERLGFRREAQLERHSAAGKDMYQYALFAEDWK